MKGLPKSDLLELKETVSSALKIEEKKIVDFPEYGSDQDFKDLIRKAVYYRDLLLKIEHQLINAE